jgi:hypothetical protein
MRQRQSIAADGMAFQGIYINQRRTADLVLDFMPATRNVHVSSSSTSQQTAGQATHEPSKQREHADRDHMIETLSNSRNLLM